MTTTTTRPLSPQEEKASTKNHDPEVPSMTTSLVLYWIMPLIVMALLTKIGIEPPETKRIPLSSRPPKSIPLDRTRQSRTQKTTTTSTTSTSKKIQKYSRGYQQVYNHVQLRRQKYNVPQLKSTSTSTRSSASTTTKQPKVTTDAQKQEKTTTSSTTTTTTTPQQEHPHPQKQPHARGAATDPARVAAMADIAAKRQVVQDNPTSVFDIMDLASTMRQVDLLYHDGGSLQMEALDYYQQAINLILNQKQQALEQGKSTRHTHKSIAQEMFLSARDKSIDGLLCGLYTAKGKLFFMANMFEKAVESYQLALEIEPLYLDALGAMGSSLLILGQYDKAGQALYTLLQNDNANQRVFYDVFTGLSKVLAVQESAVPGGWNTMVDVIDELIPKLKDELEQLRHELQHSKQQQESILADGLNRLHHAMFLYHDVKTHLTDKAWFHLQEGYKHKMSVLAPWNANFEAQKTLQTTSIFTRGFWPPHVGSTTEVPIFIIGFVRSGSTFLERILDAHSLIVGTGEDSVFNGRLDQVRNDVVQASFTGSNHAIQDVVEKHAREIVHDMRQRWQTLESQVQRDSPLLQPQQQEPLRFADKMLTNYLNVGFLHLLFPKALILHVARNPMDVVFSAYKHEFPSGTLDYTSEFASLAQLYQQYRTLMTHWDTVLPGRVTHVRYEDLVNDLPGMARAIIDSTGQTWEEGVLDFYKKRHAVNTLSTTQVRKNVYKDSVNAWKRYQEQLQPLVELLGDDATWDLKTTLPSYVVPTSSSKEEEE